MNQQIKNATIARKLLMAATDPIDLVEIWLSAIERAKTAKGSADRKLVFELLLGKTPLESELMERVEYLEGLLHKQLEQDEQNSKILEGPA